MIVNDKGEMTLGLLSEAPVGGNRCFLNRPLAVPG